MCTYSLRVLLVFLLQLTMSTFCSLLAAYYHPKFIRGELDLAASIAPSKIKGRRGRRPKSEDNEPDFYWADETITKEDADEKKKVADTNDGPNSRPGVLSSTREMMLSTSAFIRSDPRRPAEAKAADSLTDSPDQSALEVLLHSLPRDDAAGGNRQGYESIWPTMPEHQAIRQQDTGVTTSQVDTTRATGVATRRFSDFSEVSNTWLWNSLSTDEMPAAASMPRAHHPEQQQQQQQLGDPDVAFKTIGALSPRLDDINLHLQGAQTQQLQEHHLQRVLQEQRLKDLMELTRKQQHNLRIQQEELEQQRRDLQLREQEQLQRLGMELELQREQNRVQERSQVQQFRQAAPLPQRPEFFHPPIQQEPFTGSHIDQVPIQQDQRESRKSEPRGTGGSQQQNDEKSPGKSARGFS